MVPQTGGQATGTPGAASIGVEAGAKIQGAETPHGEGQRRGEFEKQHIAALVAGQIDGRWEGGHRNWRLTISFRRRQ
jgi:hypothetical protein